MVTSNFADNYRTANLSPGPDIIRLRQEAFDKLQKELDTQRVLDLVRLYFGLPTKEQPTWFRDAFAETDSSFSMLDNEREAAVLASCMLAAGLENGVIAVGLSILTTSINGHRTPLIERLDLVGEAQKALRQKSISEHQRGVVDIDQIKLPAELTPPDIQELTTQVLSVLRPIAQNIAVLEEENAILWWYVGG